MAEVEGSGWRRPRALEEICCLAIDATDKFIDTITIPSHELAMHIICMHMQAVHSV